MKLGQDGKLFTFIPFIPESTHIIVWNGKRAEKCCFNSQGNIVIEKVRPIPSKTKINSWIVLQIYFFLSEIMDEGGVISSLTLHPPGPVPCLKAHCGGCDWLVVMLKSKTKLWP